MLERDHRKNAATTLGRVCAAVVAVGFLAIAGPNLFTEHAHAACPGGVCGDVNASGTVTSADVIYLFEYLFNGGAAPMTADCGDVDDYELTTARDYRMLLNLVFKGVGALDCDLAFPPLGPPLSADYKIVYDPVFPAGAMIHGMDITLVNTKAVTDLILPVALYAAGATGNIWNVTMGPDFSGSWDLGTADYKLLFAFIKVTGELAPGTHLLATVDLITAPAAFPRVVHMTFIDQPPVQAGSPVHRAMIIEPDLDAFRPLRCPDAVPGDVDDNTLVQAADVIGLVNYVFKGMNPPVAAAGDVNCSATLTSADIITLVTHVFKGGAICDLCT